MSRPATSDPAPSGPNGAERVSPSPEERLRRLIESIKDYSIFLLGAEGQVQTWNAGARATQGYTAEEIIGQHLATFYGAEDRASGRPQRLLERAAREGRVEDQGWQVRKDGTCFWADVVITALHDDHGRILGFGQVTRDLTARRQGDEALRHSEERFKSMVSSVRDYAIFMLDAEGHVETWNDGAELAKGYRAEEIIGRHISTFYTPEDAAAGKPQRLLAAAARDGRIEDEGWRVRKDGTRFWADVVISAVLDGAGRLRGFTKVTRDLTAKRASEEALRQSEQRFRVLVESVKDHAIFMLDPQGRVATWNQGAERIKGYSAREIIGQHFSRFYLPEDVACGEPERALAEALSVGKLEEEGDLLRRDGSRFWASVVIEPLRSTDGSLRGFAMVTRDLTERRAAELERLRLAQAEEAVRLRDEFLSIASHELKTPLSAVQLQLQALVLKMKDLDEPTRRRAERAYKGGERLADLVETLMDVSRIATGRLTLNPTRFDLSEVVTEVAERFHEQAQRSGSALTVHVPAPLRVEWDRIRVEQVLMNLVANALKYAAGTRIELSATAEGDRVRLAVSDEGPGISEADRHRIFGRFERATSMRHYGGLGLGLYVARQIAEAHGGAIAVEQVHPRGARFIVTLPVMTAQRTSDEPQPTEGV